MNEGVNKDVIMKWPGVPLLYKANDVKESVKKMNPRMDQGTAFSFTTTPSQSTVKLNERKSSRVPREYQKDTILEVLGNIPGTQGASIPEITEQVNKVKKMMSSAISIVNSAWREFTMVPHYNASWNCSCSSAFITHTQNQTKMPVPANAMSNFSAATTCIGKHAFQYIVDTFINAESPSLQVPCVNELTYESQYHLVEILTPLLRFGAAILLRKHVETTDDPLEYLHLFLSLSSPNISFEEFTGIISSHHFADPELLSREKYTFALDFSCLENKKNQAYYLASWAFNIHYDRIHSVLEDLSSGELEDPYDGTDLNLLRIGMYHE